MGPHFILKGRRPGVRAHDRIRVTVAAGVRVLRGAED
ncbi:hypothetical protein SAMN05216276_100562 [Streptosporangium subroseum]|uniref:Uncharacterized protein n=1 Tax=Streptosporangium subroseum TaxID=106412 RepID=A0A239C924_9ACTN|nr:hypothetical protein SAMN05216276_100562 [Streptosporangium subroseum]